MRITLITSIFPPDIGGPATYVPNLAAALTKRGHTVKVATSTNEPQVNHGQYCFPVTRIRRFPRWRRMSLMLAVAMAESRQADVIFANGPFIEATLAAQLVRRPLVMKIVGDWIWERCRNSGLVDDSLDDFQLRTYSKKIEIQKRLRNWITRQADHIIVPSNYLRQIVLGWGVAPERLHVIYNAEESVQAARLQMAPFAGATLVTIARLVRWKGVASVIRVAANLPETRLFVIGDGPLRTELQEVARLAGAQDRIHFVGNISRPEVEAYLTLADLFVLNSSYEGLPHVIIEAMLARTPVVATAAGGIPELVQDGITGCLVPVDDETILQETIEQLLASPAERERLAAQAFRHATEEFGFETMIGRTEAVLRQAAGSEKG